MLFHVYGANALPQWLALIGVLVGLILLNEFARKTKFGGAVMFFAVPAALTIYFIAIAIGVRLGQDWAINNQFGVMTALQSDKMVPVPLKDVIGKHRQLNLDYMDMSNVLSR